METIKEAKAAIPKDYSISELRVWYKPRTWFRRELVPKESETRGQLSDISRAQIVVLNLGDRVRKGTVTPDEYYSEMMRGRRLCGNAHYR